MGVALKILTVAPSRCFWCDMPSSLLTRDHVVPVALGGGDVGNVVMACERCNLERGKLTGYKVVADDIALGRCRRRPRGWPKRLRQVIADRLPELLTLQAKWRAIETERWGPSPSGEFDFPAVVPAP